MSGRTDGAPAGPDGQGARRLAQWLGSLCGCLVPGRRRQDRSEALPVEPTESDHAGRPDISSIEQVGIENDSAVAKQRLREALNSFQPHTYDLNAAAKANHLHQQLGEGACVGLSTEWILRQMDSPLEEPGSRIQEMGRGAILAAALSLQQDYEARRQEARSGENPKSSEEANHASIVSVLEAKGLQAQEAARGFDEGEMPGHLREPGCRLLAFSGWDDGHAIAAYRPPADATDQSLRLFDPNLGEFAIGTDDDLVYFFEALRHHYLRHGQRYDDLTIYRVSNG